MNHPTSEPLRVPPPTGETDLGHMLASLTVTRRPGRFTVTTIDPATPLMLGEGIEAVVSESEGVTVVATTDAARSRGWPIGFEAVWLTLDVHSSLEAVGLTAAFAKVLADDGIACNVIAGYFHDHLLVPADRAEDAERCLRALSGSAGRTGGGDT